jgi:DNA-directed RNA polymerase subunit M/transcription elongation factor TFIIS
VFGVGRRYQIFGGSQGRWARAWPRRAVGLVDIQARYMMPRYMQLADSASEWLRLTEHYRKMSDGELLQLARQTVTLTDSAQQALAAEIAIRRLKQPREESPAHEERAVAVMPEPDPDSPYAEDRELVEIETVWSLSDALQVQTLLDRAGIPFFLGPEKATGVDADKLNYGQGVSVKVMRVGLPWAWRAMRNYEPRDQPQQPQEEEWTKIPVPCPKCHSTEVAFEGLNPRPRNKSDLASAKYEWTCESCGHRWQDDGILGQKPPPPD